MAIASKPHFARGGGSLRGGPRHGDGAQPRSAEEALAQCSELDAELDLLKARYEQYFIGIDRRPPTDDHTLLRSAVLRLKQAQLRNTAVKFRIAALHNKLLSFERMWQRTLREMEEGTYRRDLAKARRRRQPERDANGAPAAPAAAAAAPAPRAADDFELDVTEEEEASASPAPVAVPVPAPRAVPRARASPPPARAAGGAMSEERMRALFDAYVTAKKRCKENTRGITYETLSATLHKQMPSLLDKHKAKAIDFKVVIKGGKAILKAVPR